MLHEAHEFLLSDARRCLELLGGSVLPFDIQESIIQMSLRKDQKVNRPLTDEIRMLGTAVYLGNNAIPDRYEVIPVWCCHIRFDNFVFSS